MALAITVQAVPAGTPFTGVDNGQFIMYFFFTVTPTGNYVAGGDTLSFVAATDMLKSTVAPLQVTLQSQSASAGHSGFLYYYRPGNPATIANGKMQVLATGSGNQAALAEIAAGAYPGGVTADTIVGMGCFVRI
jgi:hypothetical protein